MKAVVVGGGVAGLASGRLLADAGVDVTLVEASDRLGGKILTGRVAGIPMDLGAESFLARRPEAVRLAERVGLGDDLRAPARGDVWLWSRGRLRPLPEGTVFGAPGSVLALIRSGALSPWAVARAAVEPLLPAGRTRTGETTVGELVTGRFGREVTDVLVEPLVGGVYAGHVDRLGVAAAAGPLAEAAARHRSLLLGARRLRSERASQDGPPVFLTVTGGLHRLVEALAAGIGEIRRGVAVTGIDRDGDGWSVHLADGGAVAADAVVVGTPAAVSAELLRPHAREAADLLAGLRHASVATIALAYDPRDLPGRPAGSGMLVPRASGRLVKAVTWTSSKWEHVDLPGQVLMRASVGRIDDTAGLRLSDQDLAERVEDDLRTLLGIDATARDRVVTRWPDALPQPAPGHLDRVAAARASLPAGLEAAGAAWEGVGIAPIAAQAEGVAARLLGG